MSLAVFNGLPYGGHMAPRLTERWRRVRYLLRLWVGEEW